MTPTITIADRILIALKDGAVELRALRSKLADLPPGPIDYAIQGLLAKRRVYITGGKVIQLIGAPRPATDFFSTPRPRVQSNSHPWKRMKSIARAR